MSIWKSPIVYVGILIVLMVGGLVLGPLFVDWNGYRRDLEGWASRLTGREVEIKGDVSVTLFPWPSLAIEGLRIANPPQASMEDLFRAQSVEADLLLGPLLSGQLTVSAITITRPFIGLEKMPDGSAGFAITPASDASLPANISFENITIQQGTILVSDEQSLTRQEFTGLDGTISAPALRGPWKFRGEVTSPIGRLSLSLATAEIQDGEPLKFSTRIRPASGAGYEAAFEGEWRGERVSGNLQSAPFADPQNPADKGSPNFAIKAKLDASLSDATFSDIELTPADPQHAANQLTGRMDIEFSDKLAMNAKFGALHYDLQDLKPTQAAQWLHYIPQSLDADVQVTFGNLLMVGTALTEVDVKTRLRNGELSFSPAVATLPGQTNMRFQGSLLLNATTPQLQGDISINTKALRDFLGWLSPDWKLALDGNWKGQRGELRLDGPVLFDSQNWELSRASFNLDGERGTITIAPGNLRVITRTLDLDRYMPSGMEAAKAAGLISKAVNGAMARGDAQFAIQTDKLVLNGVTAEDIAIDAAITPEGLKINTLDIGAVEGARMEITAVIEPQGPSPTGSASVNITAEEPKGLLRLLGLIPPATSSKPDPIWAEGIAPLNLEMRSDIIGKDGRANVTLKANGNAGGADLRANFGFDGEFSRWRLGEADFAASLASPSSAALAKLFGLPAPGADAIHPANLKLTARGSAMGGLDTKLTLDGLGGLSEFDGSLKISETNLPRLSGVLNVDAGQGNAILSFMGLPQQSDALPISGYGLLSWEPGILGLKNFNGKMAGQEMTGNFENGPDGLKASLKADEISLPFVLASLLLRGDRSETSMTTLFAPSILEGTKASLSLEARRLTGLAPIILENGKFDATADGETLDISASATAQEGGPVQLAMKAKPENGAMRLQGDVSADLPMASLLPDVVGLARLQGQFNGLGRSPAGMVLGLDGNGEINLLAPIFAKLVPESLKEAKDKKVFAAAIQGPFQAADLKPGNLTNKFTISDGLLKSEPAQFSQGSITPNYSLHEGKLDVVMRLPLREDAPPVEVIWAGPPGDAIRIIDGDAYLNVVEGRAMQAEIKRLEALQAEQQKLLEEEQKRMADEEKRKAEELARRKAEEEQKRKAAAELAKKLEEEAAKRIAAEKAKAEAAAAEKLKQQNSVPIDPNAVQMQPLAPP